MQLYRTEKVYEPEHIAHELRAPCTRSCDLPCWRLPWRCRRRRRKSKRESSSSAHVTFPAASGSTRQKTQPSTTCKDPGCSDISLALTRRTQASTSCEAKSPMS